MSEITQKQKPVRVTAREIINSVKQVTNVDLNQVVTAYRERRITAVPNYRYYPYALMILSMRRLGIQHRIIADWLNCHVVSPHGAMNADKLSALVQQWKKLGLLHHLSDELIEEYAEKIMLMEKGVIEIPIPGTDLDIEIPEKIIEKPQDGFLNKFVPTESDIEADKGIDDIFEKKNSITALEFLKSFERKSGEKLNDLDKKTAVQYFSEQDDNAGIDGIFSGLKAILNNK